MIRPIFRSDVPTAISGPTKVFIAIFAVIVLIIIALPNGLIDEFSSPVWLGRSDMRTMATAIETYYVDHGVYPAWSTNSDENLFTVTRSRDRAIYDRLPTFMTRGPGRAIETLTTPTPYLTEYFTDPLGPAKDQPFCYWTPPLEQGVGWIMWSAGPDRDYDLTIDNIAQAYPPSASNPNRYLIEFMTYDPTNGPDSNGDVYRLKD
jgi:hypothetical protein